jgi:hypothetical protein
MRRDEFIPFLSLKSNTTWNELIPDVRDDSVPSLIDAQPNTQ